MQSAVYTEAVKEDGSVSLRSVAALFADDAFQFTKAHAICVSERVMGFGVKFVALLERLPERGVAHDDGVDDAKLIKGELILTEDTELFGAGNGAFGRLEFAGKDFH